jgi:hypothetical protein
MQNCLVTFHTHKAVFVELGLREDFNIPKFHAIQHYINALRALGSADGYNTEFSERLHIDYAKEAYRASNKRDYIEQMALWLQRQEAIDFHSAYITWTHKNAKYVSLPTDGDFEDDDFEDDDFEDDDRPSESAGSDNDIVPDDDGPVYHVAKNSPLPHLPVARLEDAFGAVDFLPALTAFLKVNIPRTPQTFIQPGAMDRFDVYNQVSLHLPPNPYLSSEPLTTRIRATAAVPPKGRKPRTPAHFDTAMIIDRQGDGSLGKF